MPGPFGGPHYSVHCGPWSTCRRSTPRQRDEIHGGVTKALWKSALMISGISTWKRDPGRAANMQGMVWRKKKEKKRKVKKTSRETVVGN